MSETTRKAFSPWAGLGQRWGHPWHKMCSYLGSFPPALARSLLVLLSDRGDVVLDPFSGRGTTLLESRLLGRIPLASDINPIAVSLTKAKNAEVDESDALARLYELERRYDEVLYLPEAHVQSEEIQLIYHLSTLAQLCYLRKKLVGSSDSVDHFLTGVILGVMHGRERQDTTSGYASISMPNTFSMSPGYVKRFVEKKLTRPYRNVFEKLKSKIDRLFPNDEPFLSTGIVSCTDVKLLSAAPEFLRYSGKVDLILTSPPYLDLVNYAKQNWIRNWFFENQSNFQMIHELDDTLTLERWLEFAETSIFQMRQMLQPEGSIAFVVGDVARGSTGYISLARELIQRLLHKRSFQFIGCFADDLPTDLKTTRIWGDTKGKATETERIVILSNSVPSFRNDSLGPALYGEGQLDLDFEPIDPLQLSKYALEFAGTT